MQVSFHLSMGQKSRKAVSIQVKVNLNHLCKEREDKQATSKDELPCLTTKCYFLNDTKDDITSGY